MPSSTWPPESVRFPKHSFLLIRAVTPRDKTDIAGTFKVNTDYPLPSDWQEQEIRLIHTPEHTWSLITNNIFYQTVIKTWMTKDKRWHISLMQKHKMPFKCPQLQTRDILFSEKEQRKVGSHNGITWISSDKGFRYVVENVQQVKKMTQMKMLQ